MKHTLCDLFSGKHTRSLLLLWGLTALSCLIIFSPFLFGDRLVVFNDAGSDTRQQYLMQYATVIRHLSEGNLSFWDWSNGFGTSMLSLNLFNPFLMLVYAAGVLFGSGHVATVLLFVILLEIFLAASFCYLFLCSFRFSMGASVTAAYLYGLSGYLLVWGQHYQFGAFVVFLPLLLFFLEKSIRLRRFGPGVSLVAAVMVCSSVYLSYMSFLLAGGYLIIRMIASDGARSARIRQFFCHVSSLLLGIGIGMAVFLPSAYYLLSTSDRLDSGTSFLSRLIGFLTPYSADFYETAFLRFFSSSFQGIETYSGYSNFYEAPVLFFSALFVILAFQYLFTIHRQEVSRKRKVLQYLAVLLFFLCMFTRIGAAAFNAFAYPFSRHSFLFFPLFALLVAFTLDQIWLRRRFSPTALVLAAVCIAAAHVFALTGADSRYFRINALAMGLLAFAMAAVVVAGYRLRGGRARRLCSSLLLLAVAASVCLEGRVCYLQRDTLTTQDGTYWGGLYDPDVEAALSWLSETDDSFYRVEKDYYSGSLCMDALEQGYRGISTYNSTPNRCIRDFIEKVTPNLSIMAEHEYSWRQIGYFDGYTSLFGIKYLLSKDPDLSLSDFTFLARFGDVCVYQNTAVTAFARFYTTAGDDAVLTDAYGSVDLERMLLETVLLDAGQAEETRGGINLTDAGDLRTAYELEEIPVTTKTKKAAGEDAVTIDLDRSVLDSYERVYMEFDVRASQLSDITVNETEPLAYHFRVGKGRTTHVFLAVPASWDSVTLTRYGGDFWGSVENIRFLGSETAACAGNDAVISVDDTTNDSRLTGTIRTEEDGFLFLPIPYEDGWTAALDGEPCTILKSDAGFVCIPVGAGEHTFTFTYHVPYLRSGVCVSVLSLLLWFFLSLMFRRGHCSAQRPQQMHSPS